MKKTLTIEGMSCGHCIKQVTEALMKITGVTYVIVDLESKSAVVEAHAEIPDDTLMQTVISAGYTVTSLA